MRRFSARFPGVELNERGALDSVGSLRWRREPQQLIQQLVQLRWCLREQPRRRAQQQRALQQVRETTGSVAAGSGNRALKQREGSSTGCSKQPAQLREPSATAFQPQSLQRKPAGQNLLGQSGTGQREPESGDDRFGLGGLQRTPERPAAGASTCWVPLNVGCLSLGVPPPPEPRRPAHLRAQRRAAPGQRPQRSAVP